MLLHAQQSLAQQTAHTCVRLRTMSITTTTTTTTTNTTTTTTTTTITTTATRVRFNTPGPSGALPHRCPGHLATGDQGISLQHASSSTFLGPGPSGALPHRCPSYGATGGQARWPSQSQLRETAEETNDIPCTAAVAMRGSTILLGTPSRVVILSTAQE